MKYSATYKDGAYMADSVRAHTNEAERTAYVRQNAYTVKVTAKCAKYLMRKAISDTCGTPASVLDGVSSASLLALYKDVMN